MRSILHLCMSPEEAREKRALEAARGEHVKLRTVRRIVRADGASRSVWVITGVATEPVTSRWPA